MSSTNELRTARLTAADSGALIDDAFRDTEAALRTVFGVPADTAMSEAMQIVAGGNVTMTGSLTIAGTPTSDLMAATREYVDNRVSEMFTRYYGGISAGDQTFPSGIYTSMNPENTDTHQDSAWTVYSGMGSGYLLVPPEEGVYLVCVSATRRSSWTGNLTIYLKGDSTDSTPFYFKQSCLIGATTSVFGSRILHITSPSSSSGQYIGMSLYQTSGSDQTFDICFMALRIASTA